MSFNKARNNEYEYLKDLIYSYTTDFELLNYYLSIREVPCLINSPLRKDEKPSMGLYSPDGDHINFTDFGTGESGGTLSLLSSLFHLDKLETLRKIKIDLKLFNNSEPHKLNQITKSLGKRTYSCNTELSCKIRNWRPHDLEYWASFGISKKWLDFGNVYPISHIFISKRDRTHIIPAEKYAYAYVEHKDNKTSLKIYQPYSKEYKWCNKHDSSTWDLWRQLPKTGDNLIITSSRKDALCIWENTGIPACSLQAESYLPKPHVIEQLKNRFTRIFILYDNDFSSAENYGHILGEKIAQEFGITQIEIPTELQSKDSSDLFRNHGRELLVSTIKNLIR